MLDIIVLAVVGVLTLIGLWKGMVRQFFGLLGLIAGYVLAMRFYQPGSKFLMTLHPTTARAISFIAIFLGCILVAHLIGWAVGRIFAVSKLGFLNRIGGGVLGFLKGCVLVSVAVVVLTAFLPADSSLFRESSTIRYILPVAMALTKVTRGDIAARYYEKVGREKPTMPKQK
jgi:membrane protein required for colicin V production